MERTEETGDTACDSWIRKVCPQRCLTGFSCVFDFPAKTCLRFLSGFRRVVFGMTRCVARPFWSITPTSGLRLPFVRSRSIICFPRIPALLCTGTAVRSFVYALHLPRRLRGKHDSAALGATVLLRPSADQPVPNAKLFSACGPVVHLAGLDRASDISPAPGAGVNVDPCSSHRSVFCRLRACVCASSGGSWPFCCTVLTAHAFSQTSQAVRCARAALGRVLSQQTRIAGCVPSETAVRRGSDVPREICAWLLLRRRSTRVAAPWRNRGRSIGQYPSASTQPQ